eukprot:1475940-Pyramimonas_sp.AAC.1
MVTPPVTRFNMLRVSVKPWMRYMPISRDRDWPVDAAYSYRGAAIGRWMRHIPIEGLQLATFAHLQLRLYHVQVQLAHALYFGELDDNCERLPPLRGGVFYPVLGDLLLPDELEQAVAHGRGANGLGNLGLLRGPLPVLLGCSTKRPSG